jgi:mannose-6-phosphate isomerase-like protein (cupin superfamily)
MSTKFWKTERIAASPAVLLLDCSGCGLRKIKLTHGQGDMQSSDSKEYSYITRLDIQYKPLEVIEEKALADACPHNWFNQTLCKVNDSVVRLGVMEGEYHWHHHTDDDEFFYVVEGKLLIDLEDKTVELAPRQGFVVPKGIRHRTRAPQRTVILMVENAGIVPTGS